MKAYKCNTDFSSNNIYTINYRTRSSPNNIAIWNDKWLFTESASGVGVAVRARAGAGVGGSHKGTLQAFVEPATYNAEFLKYFVIAIVALTQKGG